MLTNYSLDNLIHHLIYSVHLQTYKLFSSALFFSSVDRTIYRHPIPVLLSTCGGSLIASDRQQHINGYSSGLVWTVSPCSLPRRGNPFFSCCRESILSVRNNLFPVFCFAEQSESFQEFFNFILNQQFLRFSLLSNWKCLRTYSSFKTHKNNCKSFI